MGRRRSERCVCVCASELRKRFPLVEMSRVSREDNKGGGTGNSPPVHVVPTAMPAWVNAHSACSKNKAPSKNSPSVCQDLPYVSPRRTCQRWVSPPGVSDKSLAKLSTHATTRWSTFHSTGCPETPNARRPCQHACKESSDAVGSRNLVDTTAAANVSRQLFSCRHTQQTYTHTHPLSRYAFSRLPEA